MDEEGRNLIPFSKGFIVTCNSSFTRDGQTISLKAERYSLSLGWISVHKRQCVVRNCNININRKQ